MAAAGPCGIKQTHMNHKLKPLTRIISFICSIALAAVIFLPLWRIELDAPQYPEGLKLVIYPDKLGGDVDVVNGLNHYIGMRTLHTEDFVEFQLLPYIIGIFAFFGLLTVIINRKWFFSIWTILFMAFGILAMVDFYRWEYNYGHNLDPTAPIRVPGMAYQPPLIGYKQLLNFGAYSIPDAGGWIFVAVGLLLAAGLFMEWRKSVSISKKMELKTSPLFLALVLLSSGCTVDPEPMKQGDACHFCKMTITQPNFATEWITSKGRIYKFDDVHCLVGYLKAKPKDEKGEAWFVDFTNASRFVPASKAVLLQSQELRSPMGGNTAAFMNTEDLNSIAKKFPGRTLTWDDIKP